MFELKKDYRELELKLIHNLALKKKIQEDYEYSKFKLSQIDDEIVRISKELITIIDKITKH